MNVYSTVINLLGLSVGSQGFHGHLFLMLSMLGDMEDANPTPDTFENPFREILHRLRTYQNTFAYRKIAQLIGTRVQEDRYPWQHQV